MEEADFLVGERLEPAEEEVVAEVVSGADAWLAVFGFDEVLG